MKFLNYLNEDRTKVIDPYKAISLIKDNCKKNFKIMYSKNSSDKLYRGKPAVDVDFGYTDTNKGKERKSAHTENYYTLLFDNLSSWKKFPKRSRGMICSTDREYATNYGRLYHVIPFDNAKIAVAPSYDIWASFKVFSTKYGLFTFEDLNMELNTWFRRFNIKKPKTYEELKKALINLNDMVKKGKEITELEDTFIFDQPDVIKYLDKELSPDKNYFKLGITNLNNNREVWVQGKAILLSRNGYDIIIDDLLEI